MRELVLLDSALADLEAIQEFITRESGSASAGLGFARTLLQQCQKLAQLPGILGRARPELRPDIRSFPFKGYVIFFRYQEGCLEVVDVLEGHRDIEAFFGSE